MFRSSAAKAIASGVVGLATVAAGLATAAPAQAAGAVIPNPTVTYAAVSNGSAIDKGLSVTNQAGGVAVGSTVRAAVGTVNYALATAEGYKLRWFSCPSAGAAISSCQAVASSTGNGSATGKSVEYVPVAADMGRFLAAEFQIISTTLGDATTSTVTTDRAQDIKVVAGAATSTRPAWSTTTTSWKPGSDVSVIVSPWSLPPALTQTLRSLSVWACDSADAGQVATFGFSLAGCTLLPPSSVLTNVNVSGVSVAKVQTTEAMNGKYLLAQSNLVAGSGGAAYAFVIRSAAALLGTATTASAPAAEPTPAATQAPTASTETPAADGQGTAPGATGAAAANPVTPTVTIIAKRLAKRGKYLGVSVQLKGRGRGTTGTGQAIVVLVKQPDDPKAAATLKPIKVVKLEGARNELMPKKLAKGVYYLRVTYVDAGSGVPAAAVKRIRLR